MRLPGQVDYPLGIIAGDRFLDPLGWLLIPGPNDGRVSVERIRVAGMADHLTLHATHLGMMRNRRAIDFLRHGRFDPAERACRGCDTADVSCLNRSGAALMALSTGEGGWRVESPAQRGLERARQKPRMTSPARVKLPVLVRSL